jgi:hypothetical protein
MMAYNHAVALVVVQVAQIHLHADHALVHVLEDVVASVIRALADVEQIHALEIAFSVAPLFVARVSTPVTMFAAKIVVDSVSLVVIVTVQTVVRTHAAILDAMEYALQKTCKI